MDLKSNFSSPVITDPPPTSKAGSIIHSNIVPFTRLEASFSPGKYLHIPPKKLGTLDILISGCLDAMRSSSPPRKKLNKDCSLEASLDDVNSTYHSWMYKYPSAIKSFDRLVKSSKNKKFAIFLDYDGTLSPIVDDPDQAFMSSSMRSAVKNVAKYFPTAIISGRSRDKVFELVGLTELCYAGSHGMDIMVPYIGSCDTRTPGCTAFTNQSGRIVNLFQPARDFVAIIDKVYGILVENTKDFKGAKVENHKFCTSLHYRNVDEGTWPAIALCVHKVLKDYPCLKLTHGRKVLEIRPAIDWSKGKAVEFVLDSLGLRNQSDVLPIFIGDDQTDEDAFKVLREKQKGFGILVSSVPKISSASFSLRDPSEVMKFLELMAEWKLQVTK